MCMNPSLCLIAPDAASSTILADSETGVRNHCLIEEIDRPMDEAAVRSTAKLRVSGCVMPSTAREKSS